MKNDSNPLIAFSEEEHEIGRQRGNRRAPVEKREKPQRRKSPEQKIQALLIEKLGEEINGLRKRSEEHIADSVPESLVKTHVCVVAAEKSRHDFHVEKEKRRARSRERNSRPAVVPRTRTAAQSPGNPDAEGHDCRRFLRAERRDQSQEAKSSYPTSFGGESRESPQKQRQHENFRMKIKGVRVSERKIGPVKPRQSGWRPMLATELRARQVKKREAARGKAEGLGKKQSFWPGNRPKQGSQCPEQGRLVVGKEVDSPFHRRNVAIAMRQVPHRVRKNAQVEPMAVESPVTQQRNPEKERCHQSRSAPQRAARRALERIEPGLRKLRSMAEKEAPFPRLARPAPHCHRDDGHERNRAGPMRQIPKRDADIQALVLKRPVTPEQDQKKERDQPSRSTPEHAMRQALKRTAPSLPPNRRGDEGHNQKREPEIGQFEGMKARYLEPNRIRQQREKYERS